MVIDLVNDVKQLLSLSLALCMELLRFVKLLTQMASTFSGHELMTGKMEAGNYNLFQEAEDYGMTG